MDAMDYVDWCTSILKELIDASFSDPKSWYTGVSIGSLARHFFGCDFDSVSTTNQGHAIVDATESLEEMGLITRKDKVGRSLQVTRAGEELADDLTPLWEHICARRLRPEQVQLLEIINELSEQKTADYAWLEYPTIAAILSKVGGQDKNKLWSVARPLEQQLGFMTHHPAIGSDLGFKATYRGLVWTSRRGMTLESKRIDALVRDWETTSVDFKRELYLDTADQKAEFVKDVLGLANTQASGRRLQIIGFDDKTHSYHGAPDARLTQNRIEQVLTRLTSPIVEAKYQIIDYRSGAVGQIEVLRDPKKLPYRVAEREGSKDKGGKRLIEKDQIFVRHGSQTEEPTPDELTAIIEEGNRARRLL
jgi:hypothetical protein